LQVLAYDLMKQYKMPTWNTNRKSYGATSMILSDRKVTPAV